MSSSDIVTTQQLTVRGLHDITLTNFPVAQDYGEVDSENVCNAEPQCFALKWCHVSHSHINQLALRSMLV